MTALLQGLTGLFWGCRQAKSRCIEDKDATAQFVGTVFEITYNAHSFYCSTSLSNSSAEIPNSFASAIKFDVLGSELPLSHLDTACLLTPIASATNSCVILLCRYTLDYFADVM